MDFKKKDEELFAAVERCMNGEIDQFDRVYELSVKYMYSKIYTLVKDHHITEDLLQETYIKIYEKLNTLKNPRSFLCWGGTIASNEARMYLRKDKYEFITAEDENEDDANLDSIFDRAGEDHEEFIPETIVMNEESRKIIAKILDDLPLAQKLAVQYYYFDEMSVQEIAKVMDCSVNTVKSRVYYARNAVEKAVEDLDKKYGTKLFGMGAAQIMVFVFRTEAESLVLSSAVLAGAAGITAHIAATAATGAGAGAAAGIGGVAGSVASAGAVGGAAGAMGIKIAAVIAAIAVVSTGAVIAVNTLGRKETPKEKVRETRETTVAETEEAIVVETEHEIEYVEETIEETVEEPVQLSFFEENGFSASHNMSFEVPLTYEFKVYDENGPLDELPEEYADATFRDDPMATYSIKGVTRSKPDANGNVTYTIKYEIAHENALLVHDPDNTGYYLYAGHGYRADVTYGCIYDYYTGTCLSCSKSRGGVVTVDDENYSISVGEPTSEQSGSFDNEWVITPDGMSATLGFTSSTIYTMTIVCPESYDGLVIAFQTSESSDDSDDSDTSTPADNTDGSTNHIFGMDDRSGSDYVVFRISDFF